MKYLVAFLILAFAAASRSPAHLRASWESWKREYGKASLYTGAKDLERFQIYVANAAHVDALNAARTHPDDAVYNLTVFADLSAAEFKATYLMDPALLARIPRPENAVVAEVSPDTAPPASWDWRTKNVVTPVKNQGQCGSCWDFSATETTESVCALAGWPLTLLSEQQVLQCDTTDMGCSGGWPYTAYQYVISAGGYDTEANYPYTGEGGPSSNECAFNRKAVYPCPVKSWKYVEQNNNEVTMQTFMAANSPLSICVDAETWQFYTAGVIKKQGCGNQIDHCVQAVGWQMVGSTNAWIVRNSWATSWGVNGYCYVELGVNACAIAEVVTVPCVTGTGSQAGNTIC